MCVETCCEYMGQASASGIQLRALPSIGWDWQNIDQTQAVIILDSAVFQTWLILHLYLLYWNIFFSFICQLFLWGISRFWQLLTSSAVVTAVWSIIISHLNCCNRFVTDLNTSTRSCSVVYKPNSCQKSYLKSKDSLYQSLTQSQMGFHLIESVSQSHDHELRWSCMI